MIASLPWYDFAETQELYDQLWLRFKAIYEELEFGQPPEKLNREWTHAQVLQSPKLFLTQTCGYDIAYGVPVPLSLIATPVYQAQGAQACMHSSFLVKRKRSLITNLNTAITQGRFVANDERSFSGYHCVRELSSLKTFWSGSHIRSLEMIDQGEADWAAIDVVTWQLLQRYSPRRIRGVEIFAQTRLVPAPPLVAAAQSQDITKIRHALMFLNLDPQGKRLLNQLLIEGFLWIPKNRYQESIGVRKSASANDFQSKFVVK